MRFTTCWGAVCIALAASVFQSAGQQPATPASAPATRAGQSGDVVGTLVRESRAAAEQARKSKNVNAAQLSALRDKAEGLAEAYGKAPASGRAPLEKKAAGLLADVRRLAGPPTAGQNAPGVNTLEDLQGGDLSAALQLGAAPGAAARRSGPGLRIARLDVQQQQDCAAPLCVKVTLAASNTGAQLPGPATVKLTYRVRPGQEWTALASAPLVFRGAPQQAAWERAFTFQSGGAYEFRAEIDPENKLEPADPGKVRSSGPRVFEVAAQR